MKKVLFITLIFVLILTFGVYAHPPGNIELNFNLENKMLKITIPHNSGDNTDHFIKSVKVYLNGNQHIEQDFIMQTDNDVQYLQLHDSGSQIWRYY